MNEYDDLIDFNSIEHSYTNARTKVKYVGVTTFIGRFEPEFDTEYWSAREAVKRLFAGKGFKYSMFSNAIRNKGRQIVFDYIEKSPHKVKLLRLWKEVKVEWKNKNTKSLYTGSEYHARKEDKANFNKFRVIDDRVRPMADTTGIPRSLGDKINLSRNLPDGAYTELLVKNHILRMSGQVDFSFIETIGNIRWVDIDDYKTNEKLTDTNPWQNFLPPISFLEHHKINIYRLQLLLYASMFEHYGFRIRKLTITHHPDIKTLPKIYNIVPYPSEQDPIKIMLEYRKRELNLLDL